MTAIAPSIASSFYITGGTLPPDALSYVERQADADLLAALRDGEYCYVLNSRQMGKSSLCVRAICRLREEGTRTVFLDLTKFGGRNLTAEQWYAALLAELGRELGLRAQCLAYWKEHPELPAVQRLFGAIREVALERLADQRRTTNDQRSPAGDQQETLPSLVVGRLTRPNRDARLVIFVDEIDVTRSLPFSTDEFFAAIRQCYVGRATEPALKGLTFCLLGTATPAELIEDTRISPFNIGRRIEVRDFSPEEAAPLAKGLGPGGETLLARVLSWTGGHPYLTQRLCRAVAEARSVAPSLPRSLAPSAQVDRLCEGLFLTHTAKEGDDNLALVRNRLLKSEADLASLLELYGKLRAGKEVADDETNALCGVLKLSGVAKVEGGRLLVRNRIYGAVFDRGWVQQHMPDAEVRRQREAYRRGALRAAALASVVVALLGGLAVYAFTQRNAATGNAARAERNFRLASTKTVEANLNAQRAEANARRADDNARRANENARRNTELAKQRAKALQQALTQKQRADGQTLLANRNAADARQQAELARKNAQQAEREKGRARAAEASARYQAYVAKMNLIQSDWETASVGRILALLEETRGYAGRGFEWGYWNRLCHLDLRTLKGHTSPVLSVSFSPDGRRIVTGSGDSYGIYGMGGSDNTAKVWDAESGRETLTLTGHTDAVLSVSFSPDGRRILTGSGDKTAKVWDAQSGHETLTLIGHISPVNSVSFSPDGRRILTGSGHSLGTGISDNTAKVWDAESGRETLTLKGHLGPVRSVSFSPDGRRILTGSSDKTAKVWDAQSGRETLTLTGHTLGVTSVSFSPDGRRIVTGSGDFTAKVWDAQSGREMLTLRGHTGIVTSVSFSPDGRRIVTGSGDRTAKVWDAVSGDRPRRRPGMETRR